MIPILLDWTGPDGPARVLEYITVRAALGLFMAFVLSLALGPLVIAALPRQRQTLLFSATMPLEIQQLADSILINPVHVEVTPQATTVEKIDQHIFFIEPAKLRGLGCHRGGILLALCAGTSVGATGVGHHGTN